MNQIEKSGTYGVRKSQNTMLRFWPEAFSGEYCHESDGDVSRGLLSSFKEDVKELFPILVEESAENDQRVAAPRE